MKPLFFPENLEIRQYRDDLLQSVNEMYENLKEIHNETAPSTTFFDRGNADSYDFSLADFTTDGEWHDLDLSAILPSGAKCVIFWVQINDDATSSWICFRKKGSLSVYNQGVCRTQVANVWCDAQMTIPCDSNRVIEYSAIDRIFTGIYLIVNGWTY